MRNVRCENVRKVALDEAGDCYLNDTLTTQGQQGEVKGDEKWFKSRVNLGNGFTSIMYHWEE